MKKKPPLNKKFECPVCRRIDCNSEDNLILHIVSFHKLTNSLERDHCIIKIVKPDLNTYKCIRCSQVFQNNEDFFIHLFKNHLDEVTKTIRNSRLKANADTIENLFMSFRVKNPQPPPPKKYEKLNLPDVDYILTIEHWEQGMISNLVDSEVQTDLPNTSLTNRDDTKQNEQQNEPKNLVSTDVKNTGDAYISKEAKRIYEIDNQDFNIISSNINLINNNNDSDNDNDDDDDDDDYLSFIASTIDTSNVRLQNGKIAPSTEEKKKVNSKKSDIDERKEEERSFFDKLEHETDMLTLQKIIINNQTQHKCLKCKMDFDDDIMLMKHIWDYHNDDELFLF